MLGGDVAAAVRQPKDLLGRGCPRCREYLAVCCNHRSPRVCPGKTGERVLGHVHSQRGCRERTTMLHYSPWCIRGGLATGTQGQEYSLGWSGPPGLPSGGGQCPISLEHSRCMPPVVDWQMNLSILPAMHAAGAGGRVAVCHHDDGGGSACAFVPRKHYPPSMRQSTARVGGTRSYL